MNISTYVEIHFCDVTWLEMATNSNEFNGQENM